MNDVRRIIDDLSNRRITRKQFLLLVSGSFFGMFGVFRALQELNTPSNLKSSDKGVFGEREYGHSVAGNSDKKQAKKFNEDVFG